MPIRTLTLTREVRIGLHESAAAPDPAPQTSANGFAANPALTGIAPFLLLKAAVTGRVDPRTGMLINIKIVDQLLRQHAVPILRQAYYGRSLADSPIRPVSDSPLPPLVDSFRTLAPLFAPHTLAALTLAPSPYLSFTIHHQEPAMVQSSQRFEFSAAHRLHAAALSEKQNQEIFGRCNNPHGHGHNYELEVTLAGTPDPATGHLLPGGVLELQRIVNEHVLDRFDHKHLNLDCPEFNPATGLNPTVENIAKVIYQKLRPAIPAPARLHNVRVWETPKTMCEYSE